MGATFHQLQCMRSFVAVAEASSFSRAAHALQSSPATVSDHVGNLERHLCVPLLHRTTRSVRLTDEGRQYLALCREVLDRIAETEQHLARGDAGTDPSGLLRVEMAEISEDFLFQAVLAFQAQYPGVSVQLLRSRHQFDVSERGAEVIIRAVAPQGHDPGRLVSHVLGQSRTVFLASPDYLARRGVPAHPDELVRHDCIGYLDPLSGRLWEWYFEEDGPEGKHAFSRRIGARLAMAQGELRRRAAIAGHGIINDIAWLTASLVRSGALVPVLDKWTMAQPVCYLAYDRATLRIPRVKAFVEFVCAWCERRVTAAS